MLNKECITPKKNNKNPHLEANNGSIIIVGNGPVGVKVAQLLLKKIGMKEKNLTDFNKILIFGEESHPSYNRIQLSYYLSGKISESDLDNPVSCKETHFIEECFGRKIVTIDRENKTVTDNLGVCIQYSKLILATGSRAKMPAQYERQLKNTYLFRTLEQTKSIIELKKTCRHFYIVGSGSLGLEAAVALKRNNTQVTIESRGHLLHREIGGVAQKILQRYFNTLGIKIIFNDPLKTIIKKNKMAIAVELSSGQNIEVDCLIFCVGIFPESTLAANSGLATNHGILVNEYMCTNDDDIYAVGECCEYRKKTYGVVAPGFMQAETCVEHICGHLQKFKEPMIPVQAKFGDYLIACYGNIAIKEGISYTFNDKSKLLYRKLMIKDNQLIGAIILGKWVEENNIRIAITKKNKIKTQSLVHFEKTGFLFGQGSPVKQLPKNYVVCLCENVTRGELSFALESGCRTIDSLGKKTKAGTVCGSCLPLISDLLDSPAHNLVMRHQKAIFIMSVFSMLSIAFIFLFSPIQLNETVQVSWSLEKLWFDNFWKQVSGYSLLALCVIAVALSARKRIKKFRLGHVDGWRYAHAVTGYLALLLLMVHTGLRLGNNLNFVLMLIFLSATLMGALVGVFMARNHHWSDFKLRQYRLWLSRLHHTLLWALLPLLSFHVLSVYYF